MPLQIGPYEYLNIREPGVLVNHSCEPNAGLKDDVCLVALCDIMQGREITYDYSTTIENNTLCTFRCSCGSALCRRTIGDFSDLPRNLQHHYRRLEIVQQYIAAGYRRK
jgi:hypothetical protein